MVEIIALSGMEDLIESETVLSADVLFPRLSRTEQSEIIQQLDALSAKRERGRYERLSEVESEKQQLLRELDATYDQIFENDNWLFAAKKKGISQAEIEVKFCLETARTLDEQKHKLQENLIPAIDARLKELIEELTREEEVEHRIRSEGLDHLLTPLRHEIESKRRLRRAQEDAAIFAKRQRREAQRLAEADEEGRKWVPDFLIRAESVASAAPRRRHADRIHEIALTRHIPYLVHFTPLINIPSIVQHGLMSKEVLVQKKLEHLCTDHIRGDGWQDWVSSSIAFPNYKMLYQKQKDIAKSQAGGWAIIRIQPRALWELNCKFMITNAANSSYRFYRSEEQSSPESFELMFAHASERHKLPDYYPTDPQAEVMIEHAVPIEFIHDIVIANHTDASLLDQTESIPTTVDRNFFVPRHDYEHWDGGRRLRPHSKAYDAYIGEPA
jgi:hypothetical protein